MTNRIQRVAINTYYDAPQYCPFCGQLVQDTREEDIHIEPCPHTLFIATDVGFEYRSPRLDENLGITGISDQELEARSDWVDFESLTNRVTLPDAVNFARYTGAPACMGSYVGFAPIEED